MKVIDERKHVAGCGCHSLAPGSASYLNCDGPCQTGDPHPYRDPRCAEPMTDIPEEGEEEGGEDTGEPPFPAEYWQKESNRLADLLYAAGLTSCCGKPKGDCRGHTSGYSKAEPTTEER